MGRGKLGQEPCSNGFQDNNMEKIRALQEKYKKYEDLASFGDTEEQEYQSLSFLDDYDICDETDGMFKHIHDNLMPCKTELSNLEEELGNLKRKFKTPRELLEQKHKSVWGNSKDDNDVKDNDLDDDDQAVISRRLRDIGRVVTRPRGQDSHRANEEDVRHMVCDTKGLTYTVHIPATVLELDMEEDFIHTNDSVIVKVRDSVMTRVSLSWSQDNEVTIAGLGMLNRLGLTKKDLQPCIDRLKRDDTGAEVELVGERAVELIRNRKRVLTRIVFTPHHSGVTGILLSWFAAHLLKLF